MAHFKETDLDRIHVGDQVAIELDAFPKRPLHGTVESIGAGTGSTFSLLPADNASGNFIKVVQRVAVRVAIDPGESVADLPASISVLATVGGKER
ncbi:MAG: HlyD family secretion protein [Myxococcota bacterium]